MNDFETFYLANPLVYDTMVALARTWVQRTKRDKLGFRMLWERARWEIAMVTVSDDDYKLNDHYCPYYARVIMYREPDLDELFECRTSHADAWMLDAIARKII